MNSLFVEQYRPRTIDNYLCNQEVRTAVTNYLSQQDIPHLLLHGKAGTGKTTLAKLLVNNITCDHLYVNASDENSVDAIRFKIKAFTSSVGFNDLKVVILDEADFLTPNAQAALRNLMETFSKHSRFILTCNYVERIIDPVQSRCQIFNIALPNKTEAARRVKDILEKEQVKHDIVDIGTLVNANYPDMRRIINATQKSITDKVLKLDNASIVQADFKKTILDAIIAKKSVVSIRQIIADNQVREFSELFTYIYENIETISAEQADIILLVLAQYQYQDALVVDKEINFAAMLSAIKEKVK